MSLDVIFNNKRDVATNHNSFTINEIKIKTFLTFNKKYKTKDITSKVINTTMKNTLNTASLYFSFSFLMNNNAVTNADINKRM